MSHIRKIKKQCNELDSRYNNTIPLLNDVVEDYLFSAISNNLEEINENIWSSASKAVEDIRISNGCSLERTIESIEKDKAYYFYIISIIVAFHITNN